MARPFVRSSLPDLEAAFDREHANSQFLGVLLDELTYRSTNRAARLRVHHSCPRGALRRWELATLARGGAVP